MKQTVFGLAVALGVFALTGCPKSTPPASGPANAKARTGRTDSLKPALDLVRQATEVAHYRDAMHLLNSHLTQEAGKQVVPFAPETRETLGKLYGLDSEEMGEVDALLFRPIDAYHLESCFLFRDAGRLLEIADAPPLEQVRVCFHWVMRRVQLHEQADEGVPASYVLRRGFGSGLDRALVFLAVLRQFQIEGCLLAPSGAASGPILAGALLPRDQKTALFLFDPRLGQPIVGPENKGIATLSDVHAHPDLLKASAITPELVPKLEVYQAGPLESLPARMRFLQDLLAFQDKVILFQDAVGISRDLTKAAGREALVWNSSTLPKTPSPTRALRLFLSPENGGIDKRGRLQRYVIQQIPWPGILVQLQEMRLVQSKDIPEDAREVLLGNTKELFTKFALQPKEYFLRGQFDAALKRLGRMRDVLETEEAAKPLEEAAFQKQLNDWRARVNEAYIAKLVRKEAGGPAKVEALWNEDQYLLNVLHVDSEIPLQRFEKKFLSLILLQACREPLGQQVNYIIAACLHEKAAQLQAHQELLAGAGRDIAIVKIDAGYAWKNARNAWSKYLYRHQLSTQSLPQRLGEIQQRWNRGDVETALNLWEQLHLDMHTTFQARFRLMEAQEQLQSTSPALKDLLADLDNFPKSDMPKNLNACLENARSMPLLTQRLELLARDWAPQGNIHWLRETAQRRLPQAK